MLEPHRTLLTPGQGISRGDTSPKEHQEYPKHMIHPGYKPGEIGQEIKSPHGFSYHVGGTAIRFPPVLATNADQEEMHKAEGYVSIGPSDPAAFARAVAVQSGPVENYVAAQYPKWIAALGRAVESAEEEAEALGQPMPVSSSEVASDVPAVSAEVNTLFVSEPTPEQRQILELKALLDAQDKKIAELIAMRTPAVEPAVKARAAPPKQPAKRKLSPEHMEKLRVGKERARLQRAVEAEVAAESEPADPQH